MIELVFKELKQIFEQVGMTSVKTYINSGNIVFADENRSQVEVTRPVDFIRIFSSI